MQLFFRLAVYLIAFLCGASVSVAQEYKVTLFQVAQGLPTNLTKSIIKDEKGFVWIGTDAGLIRFDGKNVKQYKKEVLSPYFKSFAYINNQLYAVCDQSITKLENLIDTVVFTHLIRTQPDYSDSSLLYPKIIYKDKQAKLWISEPRSVAVWDGKQKVRRYPFPEKYHTSSFLRAFCFAEDDNGHFFVSSQQGFLFLYNREKDRFIELDIANHKIGIINGLCAAGGNTIWIAGQNGLYEAVLTEKNTVKIRQIATINNASIIQKDDLGNFFVGTWNAGLYHIKQQGENIIINHLAQFAPKVINDIYITPQKEEIWVSTDEGIAMLRLSSFATMNFKYERQYIQDVIEGNKGTFYVTDAAQVYSFTIPENPYIDAKASHKGIVGVQHDDILCLTYRKDTLYFATTKGYLYRYSNNRLIDSLRSSVTDNTTIFHLNHDSKGNVWACKDEVLLRITPQNHIYRYNQEQGLSSRIIVTYVSPTDEILVGGIHSQGYLFRYDAQQDKFNNISLPIHFKKEAEFVINDIQKDAQGVIWLASNYGLLKQTADRIEQIDLGKNYDIKSLVIDEVRKTIWLGTDLGVVAYHYPNQTAILYNETDGLPSKTISFRGLHLDQQNRLWVATAQGLGFLQPTANESRQTPMPTLTLFEADGKTLYQNYYPKLSLAHGHALEIDFASLVYPADNVFYQYRIIGITDKWSVPSKDGKLVIPQMSFGDYTLEVRAWQESGATTSKVLQVPFTVTKPWFLSWWAIALYVLAFVGTAWLLIKANTMRLRKQNIELENVIQKRTQELQQQKLELQDTLQIVNQQKEEIHTNLELLKQQAEELNANVELVEEQNREIERKSHAIIGSINYALRIQRAILPSLTNYDKAFGKDNYFILYKPKDIVSGDFYWFGTFLDEIIVVVADCTGHGVPGAFMTLLGSELLFEIVEDKTIIEPSEILKELDAQLKRVLKHKETDIKDGMDIGICVIDFTTQSLTYAGANIPLYYLQTGYTEIQTLPANKFAMGSSRQDLEALSHQLDISQATTIYMTTDGYQDQFGGKERRKFLSKNLKKLLFDIHTKDMKEQQQLLNTNIENWKDAANTKQIDDILVLGIKL
jgi:ligand-binding sensor domain-containing protein/serine phosphatase RsbU (regulator of sigma subunit)